MTTEGRVKQLEDMMVEMPRKQDRTVEELAGLREGQSELNTKVVRLENRTDHLETKVDEANRNILSLSYGVETLQQETTANFKQLIDLIRGLK